MTKYTENDFTVTPISNSGYMEVIECNRIHAVRFNGDCFNISCGDDTCIFVTGLDLAIEVMKAEAAELSNEIHETIKNI